MRWRVKRLLAMTHYNINFQTTLARLIASTVKIPFVQLSAVDTPLTKVREVIQQAVTTFKNYGKKTLLFVDEIHRYVAERE